MTLGLTERSIRCPCCKRTFTVHVDALRHVFVEARPQGWPANYFVGNQKGARRVKRGADVLRDKRQNTTPRYPGQTRAWDTQGRATSDEQRASEGADEEARKTPPCSGEEDE